MRQITMTLRIFIISFIGLVMYSCCNESDENSGIIHSDLSIDGFYIVTYDCLNLPDTACIRDENQYNEIFRIIGTDSDCGKIIMPEIDFAKYSILINHKSGGGKHFYHRTVNVDSTAKIVTYLITSESCPVFTDYETDSYNLVLVPKIGTDYKIDYK